MTIEFDENGHAVSEGKAHVYHYDSLSGEYLGASDETIPEGVSIPGSTTLIAPGDIEDGHVWVWDGSKWVSQEDNRGKKAYSITDQSQRVINYIGRVKDGFTLKQPATKFDKWNGDEWVTDTQAQHAAVVTQAEAKKQSLLDLATQKIAPLQDAVDLDMATDEEKVELVAWKKYRVFVNRVDTSTAPNITWPTSPDDESTTKSSTATNTGDTTTS